MPLCAMFLTDYLLKVHCNKGTGFSTISVVLFWLQQSVLTIKMSQWFILKKSNSFGAKTYTQFRHCTTQPDQKWRHIVALM